VRRIPPWLLFESVLLCVVLGGFVLVPFAHLWGQLPSQPVTDPSPAGAPVDPRQQVLVICLFAVPGVLPLLLCRLRPAAAWPSGLPLMAGLAVAGLVLLPPLVSLATYPCCTSDVLDYVNRQRLWAVHGGNPFTVTPDQFPDDWTYAFSNFQDYVEPYGPGWWLLTRLFTVGATRLEDYLLGLKMLAAVCYGVSVVLIWRLTESHEHRLTSLLFFAWSPVLLIDGLVRLHNDLLTVPFVLGAVWLWRRDRAASGLAAIVLAALIKMTVAPVVLPMILHLLRAQQWRAIGVAMLIGLGLAVAAYAPFWVGLETLAPLLAQAAHTEWSLGSAFVLSLTPAIGPAAAATVARAVLMLAAVVLVAAALRHVSATPPRLEALAATAAMVMTIMLVTLPFSFYSHYLMPVIALAAVTSDARVRSLVLGLTLASVLNGVLGVDSLLGGLSGTLLEAAGSAAIVLVLLMAMVRGSWVRLPGELRLARASVVSSPPVDR
jgi:glycosyl transferase family 87